MRAVVENRGRALAGAGFREVDAEARTAALNVLNVHALGAQRADGGIANRVGWNARDVGARHAEVREAHGDVGFAAAERRREAPATAAAARTPAGSAAA